MTTGRKIVIFALFVLPVLLIAVFNIIETRKAIVANIYKERSTEVALSAQLLKAKLDQLKDIGLAFTTRPVFKQYIEESNWSAAISLMNQVPKAFDYINRVILLDTSGHVMAVSASEQSLIKTKPEHFSLVPERQVVPGSYITGVYTSPGEKHSTVCALVAPVAGTKVATTGLLVLEINIRKLLNWNDQINIGKTGYVYIVDRQGQLAFDPTDTNNNHIADYSSVPAVRKALSGEKNVTITYNPIVKERRISAYEKLAEYGWAVIAQQPERDMQLAITRQLRLILLFYSLLIIFTLAFAWAIVKEIIRRKNIETSLRTYTDLVENTQVVIRNMKNEIIFWNKGMERLYGWTKQEAIGKISHHLFATQPAIPLSDINNILLASGQWQGELMHRRKDGSIVYASSNWALVRDRKNQPAAIIETTSDITELKKAEDQVAVLSRQINRSNDAIYSVDHTFRIKTWNRGAEKAYGYTQEEALGNNPDELLKTNLGPVEINNALLQLSEHDYWTGELKRKTKQGKDIFMFASIATIRKPDKTISGYLVVCLNITEQVMLREKVDLLAAISDQSADTIASVSMDIKLTSWNRGAEKLHGYTRAEAIGKTPQELGMIDLTDEKVTEIFNSIIEKGSWESEMVFYRKDRSSFFGAINANQIKNKENEINGVGFVIKDISERKKLADQLRLANTELEARVQERTREAISHELRFRAMVENSNDIVSMMDASLNVTYRSPSSERISGWTLEELRSQSTTKIHPDDIATATEAMKNAIANPGKLIKVAMRALHKKGHYLSIEGTVINLLHDKNVASIVTNFRDVTEREIAERKIVNSEKRFRLMVENTTDIIALLDESFNIIYRSPSTTRLTTLKNVGDSFSNYIFNFHPDDRAVAEKILMEAAASPAKLVDARVRMMSEDGNIIWLDGSIVNLLHIEGIQGYVINCRNITDSQLAEQKLTASEQRFRALIENSNDAIILIDKSLKSTYRSPSATRMTGWTDEETLLVDRISHTHPEDLPQIETIYQEAIKEPGRAPSFAFPFPAQTRALCMAGGNGDQLVPRQKRRLFCSECARCYR